MKYLLVLAVVLIGVWLWRSGRLADQQRKAPPSKPAAEPQDMVRCQLCSVHFPKADSVPGKLGAYCSVEHRQRAEP